MHFGLLTLKEDRSNAATSNQCFEPFSRMTRPSLDFSCGGVHMVGARHVVSRKLSTAALDRTHQLFWKYEAVPLSF